MKKTYGFILGTSVVSLSIFGLFTYSSNVRSQNVRASVSQAESDMEVLFVDERTWEAVGSSKGKGRSQFSHLNTPAVKSERAKAALSLLQPEEYERRFPKSERQMAEELEAAHAITRPHENYQRVQATKTREQILKEEEEIERIRNPDSR